MTREFGSYISDPAIGMLVLPEGSTIKPLPHFRLTKGKKGSPGRWSPRKIMSTEKIIEHLDEVVVGDEMKKSVSFVVEKSSLEVQRLLREGGAIIRSGEFTADPLTSMDLPSNLLDFIRSVRVQHFTTAALLRKYDCSLGKTVSPASAIYFISDNLDRELTYNSTEASFWAFGLKAGGENSTRFYDWDFHRLKEFYLPLVSEQIYGDQNIYPVISPHGIVKAALYDAYAKNNPIIAQ